jgi:hypothetical protein
MTTTDDDRPLRVCDLCGGVDNHPRHVIAGPQLDAFTRASDDIINRVLETAPEEAQARLLRDLMDTGTTDRHMDCCRDAGCPDGTCDVVTAGAEDKRGDELLTHLMSNTERS